MTDVLPDRAWGIVAVIVAIGSWIVLMKMFAWATRLPAYLRLRRLRQYQALADERNPRTRAIRKFTNARVVRHSGSEPGQHAATAYASRPLLRVIVTGKARGSDPHFGG